MRAFIAVNLSERCRAGIAAAIAPLVCAGLPVRWVDPSAYHVTLKFLGQVPETDVERVGDALSTVARAHAPLALRLTGAGAFPDERRPAVFWLGVTPDARLAALQQAVEVVVAPLGYPTERRAFHPHVTLGRARRDAGRGALRGAESLLRDVAYDATIDIDTVDLMRSLSAPQGARYERVLAAALVG